MTCNQFRKYISAYIDHELGLELALALEEHAEKCDDCSRRLQAEQWTAALVRSSCVQHRLPPGLVDSLRRRIGERQQNRSGRWPMFAALAALVLVGLTVVPWWLEKPSGAPPQVAAALQLYEEVVAQRFAADVRTRDAVVADRWLAERLPFYSPGSLRTSAEMELEGVAAVDIRGQKAGAVIYRAQNGPALLLVTANEALPAQGRSVHVGKTEFRTFDWNGDKVVMWNHGVVSYTLVSRGPHDGARACASCHVNVPGDRLREFPLSGLLSGRGT